jgi:hypothetical protein
VTNILRRDGTVSGQDQHHFRSRSLFKLDKSNGQLVLRGL